MKYRFLNYLIRWNHNFWNKNGRKVVVNQTVENALTVLMIEPEACCPYLKLGITKERAEELTEAVGESFKVRKDITEVDVDVSPKCKHANELFFVAWIIMEMQQRTRMPNIPGFIVQMMSGRGPGGPN